MFPALRFKTHDLPTQSILLFPVTLLYGCLGLFLMFPVGPKLLASTLGSHFQDRLPATALTKIKLKWDRMASLTVPRCRLWLCFEALGRITRLFFLFRWPLTPTPSSTSTRSDRRWSSKTISRAPPSRIVSTSFTVFGSFSSRSWLKRASGFSRPWYLPVHNIPVLSDYP